MTGTANYILFYDGECRFCNRWVQWVVDRDEKRIFLFAALESDFFKDLQTYLKIERSVNSAISQNTTVAPNKIVGYVLLGTTLLGAIITLVSAPPAIFLCIPLLFCSVICFRVKKHAWFWCILITYLLFELYLSMGIRANIMHISKIVFLVIMTMLNIFCIKDVPALPKNKRMIILIISGFGVLLSLGIVGLLLYLNNNVIGFSIYQWIYCPAYVVFTASTVVSIYQIIGFIRKARQKK